MPVELTPEFRAQYVTTVEGRDYILYDGIRSLAHPKIRRIDTTLLQMPTMENGFTVVVQAMIEDTDGRVWTAIGDANDANCEPEVVPHKIRVAETRAKGRAMRDMLDLDMILVEEVFPKSNASPQSGPAMTTEQANRITYLLKVKNLSNPDAQQLLRKTVGKESLRELTPSEADLFISVLNNYTGVRRVS